jgi:hypothetical protein
MAEVFISYKSERRSAAEHVAAVLERYGYSVWFDYQLIKGRDFGLQIDREVRAAKALVVLWCSRSVASRWVTEEVDLAHTLGILVPVKIESCELPVGFRRQDYIDLTEWNGAPRSHQLDPLLDALEQNVGRAPHLNFKAMRDYEAAWRRFGAPTLSKFALDQPLQEHEGNRGMPGSTRQPDSESAPVPVNRATASSGTIHDYPFWERQWEKYGSSDNLIALRGIAEEAPRLFANQADPIRGGFTRCMATSGSGARTIGMKTTKGHPRTALSGQAAIHPTGFCAAVPGSAFHRTSAPTSAAGTVPLAAATLSAFVLPERSNLFSPCLFTS